jgi:hypothetical protein
MMLVCVLLGEIVATVHAPRLGMGKSSPIHPTRCGSHGGHLAQMKEIDMRCVSPFP